MGEKILFVLCFLFVVYTVGVLIVTSEKINYLENKIELQKEEIQTLRKSQNLITSDIDHLELLITEGTMWRK